MEGPCVAVIDDDPGVRQLLGDILQREGARVFLAADGDEGLAVLRREPVDALFVDLRLPGRDGIAVIEEARRLKPHIPTVLVTGYASFESSVEALRLGASDYITKPFTAEKIAFALARCFAARNRFRNSHEPTAHSNGANGEKGAGVQEFIAASPALKVIAELATHVAPLHVPLFIEGETGIGKELLARVIHRQSGRRSGPFVRITCAAMREDQIEPLLFGEESQPAGGAVQPGLLEQANGGTLYLHDVCELPTWIQGKLAEVLQQGWLRRIGGQQPVPLGARLIGATSYDAQAALERGILLRALYYYLNVVPIAIPPLRRRKEDIRALVAHFTTQFTKARGARSSATRVRFSPEAWDCLLNYNWPGNARELANVVKRAVLLAHGDEVGLASVCDLSQRTQDATADADSIVVPLSGNLKTIERHVITEVIKRCQGNKAAAARALGLHRKTLYRLLDVASAHSGGQHPAGNHESN